MNKVMTAADVVSQLRDGMTIGIGGWGPRRKPMALVREILERLPPAERSAWLADLRARYKPKRNFIAGLP